MHPPGYRPIRLSPSGSTYQGGRSPSEIRKAETRENYDWCGRHRIVGDRIMLFAVDPVLRWRRGGNEFSRTGHGVDIDKASSGPIDEAREFAPDELLGIEG